MLGSEKYIFNNKVDSEKTDKPNSSHFDYSNIMTDSFILQPKFNFYQTNEFDKVVNNIAENKAFSVFYKTFYLSSKILTIYKFLLMT